MKQIGEIVTKMQERITDWSLADRKEHVKKWKRDLAVIVGRWSKALGDMNLHPGALELCLTDKQREAATPFESKLLSKMTADLRAVLIETGYDSNYPESAKADKDAVCQRLEGSGWFNALRVHNKSIAGDGYELDDVFYADPDEEVLD